MDEWSYSEWITSDYIFIRSGEYWYPVLNIGQIAEAIQKVVEAVAETFKMQSCRCWKPVRYIRANDRLTDRRPPVHHIRNALPNMNRDRREKREGD